MANILVTGGAGFIGSHLCEALVARGDTVICLDDLSTGQAGNVGGLARAPNFRLVQGSVLDRALVNSLAATADSVFHLAAAVGVRRVLDDPLTALRANIEGTDAVLSATGRGHRRVVLASSSEVYGKNQALLDEQADSVTGPTWVPRWGYAAAKAVDEYLALAHWHQREVPVVIARLFNTVGPRQSGAYGMVLPRFVEQALTGAPLTVFGDGAQTRCLCDVRDVVAALIGSARPPRRGGRGSKRRRHEADHDRGPGG